MLYGGLGRCSFQAARGWCGSVTTSTKHPLYKRTTDSPSTRKCPSRLPRRHQGSFRSIKPGHQSNTALSRPSLTMSQLPAHRPERPDSQRRQHRPPPPLPPPASSSPTSPRAPRPTSSGTTPPRPRVSSASIAITTSTSARLSTRAATSNNPGCEPGGPSSTTSPGLRP